MPGFHDVSTALDRILGDNSAGNHKAFWRGKTRDEFVAHAVFGMPVLEIGHPGRSNLIHALRAQTPFGSDLEPPTPGAFMPRMPAYLPAANDSDIALIEQWIADGCPEVDDTAPETLTAAVASDATHVRYWRDIDLFFLPGLASPETDEHVGRWHVPAFGEWFSSNIQTPPTSAWQEYLAQADVMPSFEYIRLHQRRLIDSHYRDDVASVHDSLWKFGADLLPRDPMSGALPEHRMNSILDWFYWVPYLETSLRAADMSDVDLALARGWQIGIAGDGLLRRDDQRPQPIPIPEFDASDPDVQTVVTEHYVKMAPADLIDAMLNRARHHFNVA